MKAAVRNAPGKLAGGEVLGMQAKVAVVGNLGFWVDPAGVGQAAMQYLQPTQRSVFIVTMLVSGSWWQAPVGQTFTQGESTHCWQETRM